MFDHWSDTVYWNQFSWEAFAALLTGLAAVGAAFTVGLRQTKIQSRQVELQQLELRRLLFDLRRPVYEGTRDWLTHILQTGTIPNRPRDGIDLSGTHQESRRREMERQISLEVAFRDAIEKSRFVFSPHVFEALEQLWIQGNQLHYHRVSQAAGEDRQRHVDEEYRLHQWFLEQRNGLEAVFGDELKVSDGGPVTYRPLANPPGFNPELRNTDA